MEQKFQSGAVLTEYKCYYAKVKGLKTLSLGIFCIIGNCVPYYIKNAPLRMRLGAIGR